LLGKKKHRLLHGEGSFRVKRKGELSEHPSSNKEGGGGEKPYLWERKVGRYLVGEPFCDERGGGGRKKKGKIHGKEKGKSS